MPGTMQNTVHLLYLLIPQNSELDTIISLSLRIMLSNLPLCAQQVNYISDQFT